MDTTITGTGNGCISKEFCRKLLLRKRFCHVYRQKLLPSSFLEEKRLTRRRRERPVFSAEVRTR
jgi:hypothetical protein